MITRRIDELKIGDLVDLANDKFADPNGTNQEFSFEYLTVREIDRETPSCIVVYFDDYACGFPPSHVVTIDPDNRNDDTTEA